MDKKKYKEPTKFLDIEQSYFIWHKADKGYYWDDEAISMSAFKVALAQIPSNTPNPLKQGKHPEAPFLIETPETTGFYQTRPIEEEPTLFLKFAETEPTPKGILEFANKYGPITTGKDISAPRYSHPKDRPQEAPWKHGVRGTADIGDGLVYAVVRGDSLRFWLEELQDMRWTVQLWEWLKDEDIYSLSKIIYWFKDSERIGFCLTDKDTLLSYPSAEEVAKNAHMSGKRVIAGWLATKEHDAIFSRFRPGDTLLPAKYLLHGLINKRLETHRIIPRLLLNDNNELVPYLVPENLLAAMWLQFFKAITGETKYKRCAICGKWEDATEKRRNWSVHRECANRERVRKHRSTPSDQASAE